MTYWTAVKSEIGALQGNNRGKILLVIAGGWFVSIGARATFPVILPHLRLEYGLGYGTSGLLLSVMFFAYGVGALPGGILSDRIGEGRILTLSMAISVVTVVLVITAGSTVILFTATLLFGFATGMYGVARYTALKDLYPERIGSAIGVVNASSDLGQSILPPLAGVIAAAISWQLGFGLTIPLFIFITVWLFYIVPSRTSEPTSAVDTIDLESLRYVLTQLWRPRLIRGTLLLMIAMSIWQAFTGFFPTYLIEIKGISSSATGALFGLFFVLGIAIKPLSGVSYDRFGVRRSMYVLAVLCLVGLVFLPLADGLLQLIVVTVLVSPMLGFSTVLITYVTVELSQDMQGTGLGILRMVYWSVSAMSPLAFGLVADQGFFNEAFLGLAALVVLMIAFTFLLSE